MNRPITRTDVAYPELACFIDGRWLPRAEAGGESDVLDPATGHRVTTLPHATPAQLDEALAAAARAHATWSRVPPHERCAVILRAAALIRERADEIAQAMTLEQGKPLAEARGEVLFGADTIAWMAEEARRSYGRVIPSRFGHGRVLVVQEPVGPVAAFTPWNAPALTNARKIGPALAAGNAIILKAAEETPATAVLMVRAFEEAGLPPGALQLVFGVPAEVSERLIASEVIRKVSFTGSVPVGSHLARLSADGLKRVTLELGGQAPVIVFPDADVAHAVAQVAEFKFRNAGQICAAPNRFFVHHAVADEFTERFVAHARGMKLGSGLDPATTMGPMANARRVEAMERLVADATGRGARLETGGTRHGNEGFFYEPTVLSQVPDAAQVMQEEPFGPVAPITTFTDMDEVITRANAVPLALTAFIFSTNERTVREASDRVEAGLVTINTAATSLPETPFGGHKASGYGYEGGLEGLEAYTTKKLINQI